MRTITATDIGQMDKLVRVQFATSLPGVKPVALIGSIDSSGRTNLAPFSSIVHLGSNPTLLGMVTRPDVVDRHTLANILESKSWTINHLTSDLVGPAHQCSARYPNNISEFDASGLNAHFEKEVTAPFVAESTFRLALELADVIDIPTNNTKLIVGRVTLVQVPDEHLAADGSIDLTSIGLVASTALDTYFNITPLTRLPYAKAKA